MKSGKSVIISGSDSIMPNTDTIDFDSISETLRMDKKAAAEENERNRKKKEAEKKQTVKSATVILNSWLRWSWISLLFSWGLSLIWINLHAFFHLVLPSFFCKLGSEWIPENAKAFSGEMGEKTAGLAEWSLLIFLDVLALFFIIMIVAVINWFLDNTIINALTKVWDWADAIKKQFDIK